MTRPSKYEMAERVANKLQSGDNPIKGIDHCTLTVAFMTLRLHEVMSLFFANVDPSWTPFAQSVERKYKSK